jgi:hypothetical protein
MRNRCFDNHTKALLQALAPNIVLLSGLDTHRFARRVERLVPGVSVIPMLNYAHRKRRDAESVELERVKKLIVEAQKQLSATC